MMMMIEETGAGEVEAIAKESSLEAGQCLADVSRAEPVHWQTAIRRRRVLWSVSASGLTLLTVQLKERERESAFSTHHQHATTTTTTHRVPLIS